MRLRYQRRLLAGDGDEQLIVSVRKELPAAETDDSGQNAECVSGDRGAHAKADGCGWRSMGWLRLLLMNGQLSGTCLNSDRFWPQSGVHGDLNRIQIYNMAWLMPTRADKEPHPRPAILSPCVGHIYVYDRCINYEGAN